MNRARASGDKDKHSAAGHPQFIDPAAGDFRVKETSPAIALGFKNFPMDQFGVVRPALRAEAKTPPIDPASPGHPVPWVAAKTGNRDETVHVWLGAKVRNLVGLGEMSATSVGKEAGVLVLEVPANSAAAKAGLRKMDLILGVNGKATDTVQEMLKGYQSAPDRPWKISVFRNQAKIELKETKP